MRRRRRLSSSLTLLSFGSTLKTERKELVKSCDFEIRRRSDSKPMEGNTDPSLWRISTYRLGVWQTIIGYVLKRKRERRQEVGVSSSMLAVVVVVSDTAGNKYYNNKKTQRRSFMMRRWRRVHSLRSICMSEKIGGSVLRVHSPLSTNEYKEHMWP